MNAAQSTLAIYQQLLAISNECLLLAKKAEWDKLIDFSQRYIATVEKLAQLTDNVDIALEEEVQQKIRISLHRILNNEKEVKQLLQSRMVELKGLIHVSQQQHSVNTAYHKFSDSKSMLPGSLDVKEE